MTIGDVLAVTALLAAVGLGWGATVLMAALAFSACSRRAGEALIASPGICLARGTGLLLVAAVIVGALSHNAAGPIRLIAGALWAVLGLFSALGSAGIARLLGERIQGVGTQMTPFAALTRGTALYVLAGFLPIVGWFLIAPIALLFSLGGAIAAVRRDRTERPVLETHLPLAPTELGAGANS